MLRRLAPTLLTGLTFWLVVAFPGAAQDIVNPDWVHPPQPEYPHFAAAIGVDGRAVIRCSVTVYGHLSDCKSMEESPAGLGFGRAGVAAASTALVRPRTLDGEAIRSRVDFALHFNASEEVPEVPEGDVVELTDYALTATPRAREMARAIAEIQAAGVDLSLAAPAGIDEDRRRMIEGWIEELKPQARDHVI